MKISIIIPNYNGSSFIAETIRGFLCGFKESSIVVVDDASKDDSVRVIRALPYKNIHLIAKEKNGGFASSVNAGILYCLGNDQDFVLIANSDIEVSPENCSSIIKKFDVFEDKSVAVLGFKETGDNLIREGENISGFLFALRLGVLEQSGYLDETYYMYGEEQDFFRRLLNLGFKIKQTGVVIEHKCEMSGDSSDLNSWFAIRNSIYLEVKSKNYILIFRKLIIIFLIINKLYRNTSNDPSIKRLRRLGFLKGNVLLLKSIIWNYGKLKLNVKS